MEMDTRDALDVLKFELEFLEKGGYGRSPRTSWKPQLIFEDSPTCMHYDEPEKHGECEGCVLMQFVPASKQYEALPCRHISLREDGTTLDSLYRYAEQNEIEDAAKSWLRGAIAQLELDRTNAERTPAPKPPKTEHTKGIALYETMHPKCANPACPTAFHWLAGGKFFRFRDGLKLAHAGTSGTLPKKDEGGARHFWLCERCSRVFSLTYDEMHGVTLKLRWLELPEDSHKDTVLAK